ncbi:hypothetical protein LXA43DRAFT_893196 [Ganoderma leucocontextum]|nr:hypothetical protein LXA43DRAFT_893196 [Ganoderma leucocontextum]
MGWRRRTCARRDGGWTRHTPSASPQMQLLSRLIGPYGVGVSLFGTILGTYISWYAVEWTPGGENRGALRADERERRQGQGQDVSEQVREPDVNVRRDGRRAAGDAAECQDRRGGPIFEGSQERVRPSRVLRYGPFIAGRFTVLAMTKRSASLERGSQVSVVPVHPMSVCRTARAAHLVINVWRRRVGWILHQDNDDDGETAAGGRLAYLLWILVRDYSDGFFFLNLTSCAKTCSVLPPRQRYAPGSSSAAIPRTALKSHANAFGVHAAKAEAVLACFP